MSSDAIFRGTGRADYPRSEAAVAGAGDIARIPPDWPNRESSRSVAIGPLNWHVQVRGTGPTLVLLHGTGSSAHSWADSLPALSRIATVVAPDLPGHGFTTGADVATLTLPHIAFELGKLLDSLGIDAPGVVVGHSAGAALAIRWAIDSVRGPRAIMGFNPSLIAPPAFYSRTLAPLIEPVATSMPVARLLAAIASRTSLVKGLLRSTRSVVPPAQQERYRRLFRLPSHVQGAMGLMAAADLPAIQRLGPSLRIPIAFVAGSRDEWVPEAPLRAVIAGAFPQATVQSWDGGHLLHEEFPARAAAHIREWLLGVDAAAVPGA